MEDCIHCKICHDSFDSTTRRPLILPCGHTFCEYCLKIIYKSNQVKCPFDKKVHTFKERHDIGINYQIYDLFSSELTGKNDPKCPKHPNQIMKFYCDSEKVSLCQICYLSDHMNHQVFPLKDVISIEKMTNQTKSFIKNSINALEKSNEMMNEIKVNVLDYSKSLDEMKENLMKEIVISTQEIPNENLLEKIKLENQIKQMRIIEEENVLNLKELDSFKEIELKPCEKLNKIIEKSKFKYALPSKNSENYRKDDNLFDMLSKTRKIFLKAQFSDYDSKNHKMLKTLKDKGVLQSEEIFSTLMHVNRRNYVKPEDADLAFSDLFKSLKIGFNYILPSPFLTVTILEELNPMKKISPKILEIGAGSGYLTACLAYMLKGNLVSVENNENLLKLAKINIAKFNPQLLQKIDFQFKDYKNIDYLERSFDIIYCSTVMQNVPTEFEEMLALNGIMWISIGSNLVRNVSNYIFEKDAKGVMRSRKVEIPEVLEINYIF